MPEAGHVTGVNVDPQGSELDAAALSTDTVLVLGDASLYDPGETVEINGTRAVVASTDVDAGTITLTAPLGVAADESDRVFIISGGEIAHDYTLEVHTGAGSAVEIPLSLPADRLAWRPGPVTPPIPVTISDDLTTLLEAPGRSPYVQTFYPDGSPALEAIPVFTDGTNTAEDGTPAGARVRFSYEGGPEESSPLMDLSRLMPGKATDLPDGFATARFFLDTFDVTANSGEGLSMGNSAGVAIAGSEGGVTIATDADVLIAGVNTTITGQPKMPDLPSTASAANMVHFAVDGTIRRSTSSRRYKQDIAPAEVDVEAALKLTPRIFREKSAVEEHGDEAPVRVGFIAEEAADLGLAQWVEVDKDGPESFSYPLWVVALQAIVRDQQARIEALEARLDALVSGGVLRPSATNDAPIGSPTVNEPFGPGC